MRPFQNIDELGIYLRLLTDLRDTLDKFMPTVFDRSITELIAATAPKRDFPDMTSSNRRRLKKLALEYVRPGVRIGDLNEALVRIQQQRMLWHRFVAEGATPEVPVGIGDVQVAYQAVSQDLASLDVPLGLTTKATSLATMPVPQLLEKVRGLAAESEVLHNLQERTALVSSMREYELDPLIEDLARRHVPESEVAAELELAWWQSALESLLERDRALLGANTSVLDRLEADFRLVDEAHAAGSAQLLSWQLAETWKIGLVDWPDEAAALKRALRQERMTFVRPPDHRAAPLAHGRARLARVAVRRARDHRLARVRHRDPRRCRSHDARRERRRDPAREAGGGVRRPRHADARAVRPLRDGCGGRVAARGGRGVAG